jgi:hypothetical protein
MSEANGMNTQNISHHWARIETPTTPLGADDSIVGRTRPAVAYFDVTDWQTTPLDTDVPGPRLFRVRIQKTFHGDLVGESTGELLMCVADTEDCGVAGEYVAFERVTARLGDRAGTFVIEHWGVSGGPGPDRTTGRIVPGSGTGALAGMSGAIETCEGETQTRTLILDYRLA